MSTTLLRDEARDSLASRPFALPLAHAACLTATLIPLMAAKVPPLTDYLNHLARMDVMARLGSDPVLEGIYQVEWKAIPNLAMDVLVPPLVPLLGAETAGKLFIALTLALMALGAAVLHRVLHGRPSAWPLTIYPLLYSTVLAYGLLNYLFGVGLMLIGLAGWLATRAWPAPARLALTSLFSLLLFFAHLGAFAAYGLCVVMSLAAAQRWPVRLADVKAAAWEAAPFALPLGLFLTTSPDFPLAAGLHYNVFDKLYGLLAPILFQNPLRDLMVLGPLYGLLAWAFLSRSVVIHRALRWPLAGLAVAYLLVPTWMMDNWGNDLRIAIPFFGLLIAAASPMPGAGRLLGLLAIACIASLALRATLVSQDWARYDRLYDEFRAAARQLEPGSLVLPAMDWHAISAETAPPGGHKPFYHVPALALLEQPVFLPSMFTAAERQLFGVREAYRDIDAPHLRPIGLPLLREAADPASAETLRALTGSSAHVHRFAGWPDRFDVLLVIDFGRSENPLPQRLRRLHRGSYFTFYRIVPER